MNSIRAKLISLTLCISMVAGFVPGNVLAQNPVDQAKEAACPDNNFGKQIGKICWDCFFPLVVFGIAIGGSSSKLPSDKAAPICVCPGRTGYPSIGFTLGWWQPDHVIESVRQPWCMPSLGGTVLTDDEMNAGDIGVNNGSTMKLPARWGGQDGKKQDNPSGVTYYNFHWIKFPIAYLIGWMADYVCSKKSSSAIDIAFMSEFDPSWNNDELAVWTSPETVLFTGPWAPLACAVDGIASTTSKPIKSMFWCAGTWGAIYPYSGFTPTAQSDPRDASLNAIKGVAKMHRFTLAKKMYGDKALCANQNYFILPKHQYRMQTLFPIAEKKDHWVGASPFKWGEWRNIPAKGEDFVWLQWTYTECCVTLW